MQLFAKAKKILYVALNPMYRIVLNFAKNCILSPFSKFNIKKNFHRAVLEIEALIAEIKGVFSGL